MRSSKTDPKGDGPGSRRPRQASLIPFWILTTPLGRMQRVSDFSTRGRRPRTKTRTSAITHDFFLFSPRGNPQDWQPVRKTWRGDKPGRVVCVTWEAGLTWCPRVGAGRIPVLSLDQGDGRPDGTGFECRWSGGRRISSVLGQAGLGDSSGTQLGIFGQDPSRIIPIDQESQHVPFFPSELMGHGFWSCSP